MALLWIVRVPFNTLISSVCVCTCMFVSICAVLFPCLNKIMVGFTVTVVTVVLWERKLSHCLVTYPRCKGDEPMETGDKDTSPVLTTYWYNESLHSENEYNIQHKCTTAVGFVIRQPLVLVMSATLEPAGRYQWWRKSSSWRRCLLAKRSLNAVGRHQESRGAANLAVTESITLEWIGFGEAMKTDFRLVSWSW